MMPTIYCALGLQRRRLSDEVDGQAIVQRLLPQPRFHHMSHDFLCAVVSACPYANVSGLLSYIMRSSHALRITPRTLAKKGGADVGKGDRSHGNRKCHFKSTLEMSALLPLEQDDEAYKYLRLVVSFPVVVVGEGAGGWRGE